MYNIYVCIDVIMLRGEVSKPPLLNKNYEIL
mgnify:CR=1 FL=1